jgi:hypothetical protein
MNHEKTGSDGSHLYFDWNILICRMLVSPPVFTCHHLKHGALIKKYTLAMLEQIQCRFTVQLNASIIE